MNLISRNLDARYEIVRKALAAGDVGTLESIAADAKRFGADAILTDATEANEQKDLPILVAAAQKAGLEPVIRCKSAACAKACVSGNSGYIAGIGPDTADTLLPLFKDLGPGWKAVIHASFCADQVSQAVETIKGIIAMAGTYGLLPNRIYLDPCISSLAKDGAAFPQMRRVIDAFTNIYPDIHFFGDPAVIAAGIEKPVHIIRSFTTLAMYIGMDAVVIDSEQAGAVKSYYASCAVFGLKDGLMEYEKIAAMEPKFPSNDVIA